MTRSRRIIELLDGLVGVAAWTAGLALLVPTAAVAFFLVMLGAGFIGTILPPGLPSELGVIGILVVIGLAILAPVLVVVLGFRLLKSWLPERWRNQIRDGHGVESPIVNARRSTDDVLADVRRLDARLGRPGADQGGTEPD